ncbi:MAG: hypothetical protein ACI9KE_003064, partial [Polyangiales bacterium]
RDGFAKCGVAFCGVHDGLCGYGLYDELSSAPGRVGVR